MSDLRWYALAAFAFMAAAMLWYVTKREGGYPARYRYPPEDDDGVQPWVVLSEAELTKLMSPARAN